MNDKIKDVANSVLLMEQYLNENVQENKLWKNTYINEQIVKRKQGGNFELSDHIRAMVYSMLSSRTEWAKIQPHIESGEIDKIFCNFLSDKLLQCKSEELLDQLKEIRCASLSTRKQMKALLDVNIETLCKIEDTYNGIDNFYQQIVSIDGTYKNLLLLLANKDSLYKLREMDAPLVAEYLRNVGYDLCKPDRHICRILGCEVLGCSDKKDVPIYETFDIVSAIANELGKSIAEVDYILWSYCAKGYGGICTIDGKKCSDCIVKKYCLKEKEN